MRPLRSLRFTATSCNYRTPFVQSRHTADFSLVLNSLAIVFSSLRDQIPCFGFVSVSLFLNFCFS